MSWTGSSLPAALRARGRQCSTGPLQVLAPARRRPRHRRSRAVAAGRGHHGRTILQAVQGDRHCRDPLPRRLGLGCVDAASHDAAGQPARDLIAKQRESVQVLVCFFPIRGAFARSLSPACFKDQCHDDICVKNDRQSPRCSDSSRPSRTTATASTFPRTRLRISARSPRMASKSGFSGASSDAGSWSARAPGGTPRRPASRARRS